jgi:hypothetical protein
MTPDEQNAYHRTFLLFDPKTDLCKMGCHGTTGTGRRIGVEDYQALFGNKPDPLFPPLDHRTDLRRRVWEKPNFHLQYPAFRVSGQTAKEITIVPKINQNFQGHATDWEKEWSMLVRRGGRKFRPIVDENYTVIGHIGVVHEGSVIVPEDTPTGPPLVSSLLEQYPGIPVLIKDSLEAAVPEGWREFRFNQSWWRLTLVTGIDGEVIDVVYSEPTNGVAISVDSPLDYINVGAIARKIAVGIGIRILKGLGRSLSRVGGRLAARGLASGSTRRLLSKFRLMRGHQPGMGIPAKHFDAMVAAADETKCILIFRANKATALPLIERGAPGKPFFFKFKSDPQTGILTATEKAHFEVVYKHGYYTMHDHQMARRIVMRNGRESVEMIRIENPFWQVKPGQVIDPKLHKPVVGDYDMLGAVPVKSTGSNVSLVPKDPINGDWSGPVVERAAKAVNSRLDQPRVLHGAQDQHMSMGLSDDAAYAVFPDGSVHMMADKAAQEAFYKQLGRQTGAGAYPRPAGPVVDELAARRAAKVGGR